MSFVTWFTAIGIAVSVGITLYLILSGGAEVALRLWRNRRQKRFASYITRETRAEETEDEAPRVFIPRQAYPALIALLALAIWLTWQGGVVIAIALIVVSVGVAAYLQRRQGMGERSDLTDQVEMFIAEYHSRWLLNPSPFGVLEDTVGELDIKPPLSTALRQALDRYRLGEAAALLPIKALDPYLDQFGYILEQTNRAGNEVISEAFSELLRSLRLRRKLKKRVQTVMAMVRGEEVFLVVANIAAAGLALAVPLLREFYLSTTGRQLLMALAMIVVTAGGVYFDYEILALKEKAL